MGVLENLAAANAGVTSLATARTAKATERTLSSETAVMIAEQEQRLLCTLIDQNNRIIELLVENLGYLARQKHFEVEQERQRSMTTPAPTVNDL